MKYLIGVKVSKKLLVYASIEDVVEMGLGVWGVIDTFYASHRMC